MSRKEIDSWNIFPSGILPYDSDKRNVLRMAFKNQCRLNGLFIYSPSLEKNGLMDRVRVAWAKDYADSDAFWSMMMEGYGVFSSDFNVCTTEEAFAYYFGA